MINLLSNGIKYTSEGYVKVECTIDAQKDEAIIKVIDTGVGI